MQAGRTEAQPVDVPRIPRVLHRTLLFQDALPGAYAETVRRLEAGNPELAPRWHGAELPERLLAAYPEHRGTRDRYTHRGQVADFARYLLLLDEGGVYADLDIDRGLGDRPLVALLEAAESDAVPGDACVLVEECVLSPDAVARSARHPLRVRSLPEGSRAEQRRRVANYFLACTPGHPFLQAVLDVCAERADVDASRDDYAVLFSTGPDAVTAAYHARDWGRSVHLVRREDASAWIVHRAVGGWRDRASAWDAPSGSVLPRRANPLPRRLVLHVPHGSDTGWGVTAQALAPELARRVPVTLSGRDRRVARPLRARLRSLLQPRQSDQAFGVVIEGDATPEGPHARWVVWETTRLPEDARERLEATPYLWTPSSWGAEMLVDNGFPRERIAVVPKGVDVKLFHPPRQRRVDGPFRFLCVGKWEERKNIDGLVAAFEAEFSHREPVELVLHCHNPCIEGFSQERELARLGVRRDARIRLSPPTSRRKLAALYRAVDGFVLPTRGEGWGLPVLEAMASGLAPIVTGHAAPLDYTRNHCAYRVDVERMVEAHCPLFGIHTGEWAQPDAAHLRYLMRRAVENREERLAKGREARQEAMCWTWRKSSRAVVTTAARHLAAAERGAAG